MNKTLLRFAIYLRLLLLIPIVNTPLWYDENFTLLLVRLPLVRMMAAVAGDVHPPLYYLLLWPLGQIHNLPTWALRIPSWIFSCISLYVFWVILGKLITSRRVRLAAWTIMVVIVSNLVYSIEARMYTLFAMLVLLAFWALLNRRWFWIGLACSAILWTHNYGIFYCAALWMAGMLLDKRTWMPLTISIGLAGLSFVPWAFVLASQMVSIHGGYWMIKLTPALALYEYYKSFMVYAKLNLDFWAQLVFWGWLSFSLFWSLSERKRNPAWSVDIFRNNLSILPVVLVLAFAPFSLAVIGSVIWQPLLLYRALLPSVPFLCLLLALPAALPRPASTNSIRGFLLAVVLIVPVIIVEAVRVYAPSGSIHGKDDAYVLSTLHYIEITQKPGDIILHLGDGTWVDAVPYAADPLEHYKAQSCGNVRGSLSPQTRAGLGVQSLDPYSLPSARIWFITEESPMTPSCEQNIIDRVVENTAPLFCFRDDPLKRNCLYLVNKR
jgi:hypothetical protein